MRGKLDSWFASKAVEVRSNLFHKSVPGLDYWYSRRYVFKRAEVFDQMKFKYKQTIIPEGFTEGKMYLVVEGNCLLKRLTQVKGATYNIPYAMLDRGQLFNEQALMAYWHNAELEQRIK